MSRSRGLQKTPSNHNEQAASLVAQYLGQSPRSASDIATGYGALKRGKKQGEDESQGLELRSASTTAVEQQPASDPRGFCPTCKICIHPGRPFPLTVPALQALLNLHCKLASSLGAFLTSWRQRQLSVEA